MGKFLVKLALCSAMIIAVQLVVCVCIYLSTDGLLTKDSYQKGFVYQLRALERSDNNRPKMIVMGGSYMTFAMDMPVLRESMNMPAYSLGVHSGMGQSYTFEVVKKFINPGDIVVFLFAGFSANDFGMPLLYQTFDGEDDLMLDFFKAHPIFVIKSICSECSHRVLKLTSEYVHDAMAEKLTGRSFSLTGVYCASSFDPRTGDLIFKREGEHKSGQSIDRVKLDVRAIDTSCFDIVNDLYRECRSRGADMVIAIPPCIVEHLEDPGADLNQYCEELQARLLPKIIGRQELFLYPIEMMYDFPRHLNSHGAKCYTEQLAKNVQAYFETLKR